MTKLNNDDKISLALSVIEYLQHEDYAIREYSGVVMDDGDVAEVQEIVYKALSAAYHSILSDE